MQAKLVVVAGRASRQEIPLKLPLSIGRGRDQRLAILHPTVSRRHCELFERNGLLWVRDLGSANGTMLGEKKITESVVKPGERLTIGPLVFEAVYELINGAATAPARPIPYQPADEVPPGEATIRDSGQSNLAEIDAVEMFTDLEPAPPVTTPAMQAKANVPPAAPATDDSELDLRLDDLAPTVEAESLLDLALPDLPSSGQSEIAEGVNHGKIEELASIDDLDLAGDLELSDGFDMASDIQPVDDIQRADADPAKDALCEVGDRAETADDEFLLPRDLPDEPSRMEFAPLEGNGFAAEMPASPELDAPSEQDVVAAAEPAVPIAVFPLDPVDPDELLLLDDLDGMNLVPTADLGAVGATPEIAEALTEAPAGETPGLAAADDSDWLLDLGTVHDALQCTNSIAAEALLPIEPVVTFPEIAPDAIGDSGSMSQEIDRLKAEFAPLGMPDVDEQLNSLDLDDAALGLDQLAFDDKGPDAAEHDPSEDTDFLTRVSDAFDKEPSSSTEPPKQEPDSLVAHESWPLSEPEVPDGADEFLEESAALTVESRALDDEEKPSDFDLLDELDLNVGPEPWAPLDPVAAAPRTMIAQDDVETPGDFELLDGAGVTVAPEEDLLAFPSDAVAGVSEPALLDEPGADLPLTGNADQFSGLDLGSELAATSGREHEDLSDVLLFSNEPAEESKSPAVKRDSLAEIDSLGELEPLSDLPPLDKTTPDRVGFDLEDDVTPLSLQPTTTAEVAPLGIDLDEIEPLTALDSNELESLVSLDAEELMPLDLDEPVLESSSASAATPERGDADLAAWDEIGFDLEDSKPVTPNPPPAEATTGPALDAEPELAALDGPDDLIEFDGFDSGDAGSATLIVEDDEAIFEAESGPNESDESLTASTPPRTADPAAQPKRSLFGFLSRPKKTKTPSAPAPKAATETKLPEVVRAANSTEEPNAVQPAAALEAGEKVRRSWFSLGKKGPARTTSAKPKKADKKAKAKSEPLAAVPPAGSMETVAEEILFKTDSAELLPDELQAGAPVSDNNVALAASPRSEPKPAEANSPSATPPAPDGGFTDDELDDFLKDF